MKQSTITEQSFTPKDNYAALKLLILQMLISTNSPFNFVENEYFKQLMKEAYPTFVVSVKRLKNQRGVCEVRRFPAASGSRMFSCRNVLIVSG